MWLLYGASGVFCFAGDRLAYATSYMDTGCNFIYLNPSILTSVVTNPTLFFAPVSGVTAGEVSSICTFIYILMLCHFLKQVIIVNLLNSCIY